MFTVCSSHIFLLQESVDEDHYINFPEDVSDDFRAFIHEILQPDPTKRLGNLKDGAFDIKRHPLFKHVTWRSLLKQKIKAPYVPSLEHKGDTKNFKDFKNNPLKTADIDRHYERFSIFPR